MTDAEIRERFAEYGRQGGKKRARKLTAARRKEIGRKAIAARWAKQKAAK